METATTWLDRNPAAQMAVWFVQNYLGTQFDLRVHSKHLRDAASIMRSYLDPVTGEQHPGMTREEVEMALDEYQSSTDKAPSNLLCALGYKTQLAVYDKLDIAFSEGRLRL